MKLWICVIGGENSSDYEEERVIATGGIEDMDNGIEQYANEVECSWDKYFWVESEDDEWTIESVDQYYGGIRDEIVRETSLARWLGKRLLPQQ